MNPAPPTVEQAAATLAQCWQGWQPPLSALAAALFLRAAGQIGGKPALGALAGPFAVLGGWAVLFGVPRHWPATLAERAQCLAVFPLSAALPALWGRRAAMPAVLAAALAGVWWLGGAPLSHAALAARSGLFVPLAALACVLAWLLRGAHFWVLLAAAAAPWAALALLRAPVPWPFAALCLTAATAGMIGRTQADEAGAAGLAVAIALGAVLTELAVGRLPQGAFSAFDLVAAIPLLVALAAPRLGRADAALGAMLAGTAGVAAAWGVAQVLPPAP